jgi:hypothetical protein
MAKDARSPINILVRKPNQFPTARMRNIRWDPGLTKVTETYEQQHTTEGTITTARPEVAGFFGNTE